MKFAISDNPLVGTPLDHAERMGNIVCPFTGSQPECEFVCEGLRAFFTDHRFGVDVLKNRSVVVLITRATPEAKAEFKNYADYLSELFTEEQDAVDQAKSE